MSGIRFNEERNKQDKLELFIYTSTRIKLCIIDSLEDIQKCGNEQLGFQRN